jgi:putative Holliday junction resolvase
VVLCDDSAQLRELVRILLERDGHEVVGEAENGREAIAEAEKEQPDVVLLDLSVPVLDGLEALPEMRRVAPAAKVVVLSASTRVRSSSGRSTSARSATSRRARVPRRSSPPSRALGWRLQSPAVKVLALDYGAARTGVAVSDPTGTVARPLAVVEGAASEAGLARLLELVREEEAERIVVGLPVTLRGERGAQARETEEFVERLSAVAGVPVESFDERFTTVLARGSETRAAEDAVAAAHLLTSYLRWQSDRPG